MARSVSNPSEISNNDLVLLRRTAKKYAKAWVTVSGTKKFAIEGTNVSIIVGKVGLSFISIPATSVIYKDGILVTGVEEVKSAVRSLKQVGRKPTTKSSSKPELPEELKKQLEAFAKQNNSRVIFDPSQGGYKVQQLRPRQPKSK